MHFLIISQRAKANPDYNLKNLTGHGRIDILFRCILASLRTLPGSYENKVYCFIKDPQTPGWLSLSSEMDLPLEDEISLAAFVKNHWSDIFHSGSLEDLMYYLHEMEGVTDKILLSEGGKLLSSTPDVSSLIILGGQNDLTENDEEAVNPNREISLGSRSLLASHAITYFRQKSILLQK